MAFTMTDMLSGKRHLMVLLTIRVAAHKAAAFGCTYTLCMRPQQLRVCLLHVVLPVSSAGPSDYRLQLQGVLNVMVFQQ